MNSDQGKILVVDDEDAVRRALKATLTAFRFSVQDAASGEDALRATRNTPFDAVLLDLNMPGIGGMKTCAELRRVTPALPILMLTVRDNQDDVVRALDAGADDYITKPFHIRELTARLRAAVRRNRALTPNSGVLTVGGVELDPSKRIVRKNDTPVRLTPKEFDLLHCLMRHAGMPVPHGRLLKQVWGPEYGNEFEYLRTFIRQLRMKLEDDPAEPSFLLTEPYVGYRIAELSAA